MLKVLHAARRLDIAVLGGTRWETLLQILQALHKPSTDHLQHTVVQILRVLKTQYCGRY